MEDVSTLELSCLGWSMGSTVHPLRLVHQGFPDPNDALGVLLGQADGNATVLDSNLSIDRLGNVAVRVAPYDPSKFVKLQLVVMLLLPDQASWIEQNLCNRTCYITAQEKGWSSCPAWSSGFLC